MQTKVLPFVPRVTDKAPAKASAGQLQELVDSMASDGWQFVSLTPISTSVKPTGCAKFFGGGNPVMTSFQLVVFQKP